MKLSRAQWMIALAVVLTAAIGVATNLATFDVPLWLRPHLWLSWPLLVLLVILLVIVSVIQARFANTPELLNKGKMDQFVRIVNEVEQITSIDPGLENIDDWGRRLVEWEAAAEVLAKMAKVGSKPVDESRSQHIVTEPARLLMRLAQALLPTLWQRAHWNALIDLASWAYEAAVAVKDWEHASWRAYDAARTLYALERLTECAEWTHRMEAPLQHVSIPSTRDQVQAAFSQMKGLIARDLQGDRDEARGFLQRALGISEQIGDTKRMIALLTQLGKLEELDGQIDKAASLYEEALQEAIRIENYDVQLDCHDKLARLALALGNYDQAHQWCKQQLELSNQVSRIFYQARAHEGLGWIFLKRERYQEAYEHARQALAIEEQITGPRVEAIRQLVITVADKAMDIQPLVNGFRDTVSR